MKECLLLLYLPIVIHIYFTKRNGNVFDSNSFIQYNI